MLDFKDLVAVVQVILVPAIGWILKLLLSLDAKTTVLEIKLRAIEKESERVSENAIEQRRHMLTLIKSAKEELGTRTANLESAIRELQRR